MKILPGLSFEWLLPKFIGIIWTVEPDELAIVSVLPDAAAPEMEKDD